MNWRRVFDVTLLASFVCTGLIGNVVLAQSQRLAPRPELSPDRKLSDELANDIFSLFIEACALGEMSFEAVSAHALKRNWHRLSENGQKMREYILPNYQPQAVWSFVTSPGMAVKHDVFDLIYHDKSYRESCVLTFRGVPASSLNSSVFLQVDRFPTGFDVFRERDHKRDSLVSRNRWDVTIEGQRLTIGVTNPVDLPEHPGSNHSLSAAFRRN